MHAARFAGDLVVGAAEHRIELRAAGEVQRSSALQAPGHAAARGRTCRTAAGRSRRRVVELLRLPRAQAFLDLFGELRRIGRRAKRFERQPRRGLVMLAAAVAVEHEADDHVGTNRADHAHVVAEDLVVAPLLERLFDAEREAEIDRAREELLGAVEAMRREQFLGAQHRERHEQLGANLVLPAFAVRRRDERRAIALAVREVRQHRVVLVVRMRRRHHEVADGVELAQRELERRLALAARRRACS